MEEGTLLGGFGAAVLEMLNDHHCLVPVKRFGIPDQLVDHAKPEQSLEALGLTPAQMASAILADDTMTSRMVLAGVGRR